jgi:hypothetical protein
MRHGNSIACTGSEMSIAEGVAQILICMGIALKLFFKERTGITKFADLHDVHLFKK